jgi:hypothetical protein
MSYADLNKQAYCKPRERNSTKNFFLRTVSLILALEHPKLPGPAAAAEVLLLLYDLVS